MKRRIVILILAVVFAAMVVSCKMPTNDSTDIISVTGTVSSVGNVPVNQYVLDSGDTQYMIDKKYCKYVGAGVITVSGYITGSGIYGNVLDIITVHQCIYIFLQIRKNNSRIPLTVTTL